MEMFELLIDFLKFLIGVIAFVVTVKLVLDAGFIPSCIKFKSKDIHVEVSGHEKNTQPR